MADIQHQEESQNYWHVYWQNKEQVQPDRTSFIKYSIKYLFVFRRYIFDIQFYRKIFQFEDKETEVRGKSIFKTDDDIV